MFVHVLRKPVCTCHHCGLPLSAVKGAVIEQETSPSSLIIGWFQEQLQQTL